MCNIYPQLYKYCHLFLLQRMPKLFHLHTIKRTCLYDVAFPFCSSMTKTKYSNNSNTPSLLLFLSSLSLLSSSPANSQPPHSFPPDNDNYVTWLRSIDKIGSNIQYDFIILLDYFVYFSNLALFCHVVFNCEMRVSQIFLLMWFPLHLYICLGF